MINRIENVAVPPKPKAKSKSKPVIRRETTRNASKLNVTKLAASFGVIFMATLSALLNAYANGQHASVEWAGWGMGMAVPIIVLVLGKVAGDMFRKKQMMVAFLNGGSGLALLFLSVYHCSESISLLTGCSVGLAFPQAVAIDFGLIACEIAIIAETRMSITRPSKASKPVTPADAKS